MMFTSPVVIAPLAFISLRKLALVTDWRACALHKLVSPLVTTPVAFTSPTSRPICGATLPVLPSASVTPFKLIVVYWPFGIPVRFTVHCLAVGPGTTEPPGVPAVPQLVILIGKVKTTL